MLTPVTDTPASPTPSTSRKSLSSSTSRKASKVGKASKSRSTRAAATRSSRRKVTRRQPQTSATYVASRHAPGFRFSPAKKAAILKEMARPNSIHSAIARKHGVTTLTVYRWAKEAGLSKRATSRTAQRHTTTGPIGGIARRGKSFTVTAHDAHFTGQSTSHFDTLVDSLTDKVLDEVRRRVLERLA